MPLSPIPWTARANGDTPDVDGYEIVDRDGEVIALVTKKDDAETIVNAMNNNYGE